VGHPRRPRGHVPGADLMKPFWSEFTDKKCQLLVGCLALRTYNTIEPKNASQIFFLSAVWN
jgi:hypothetical protein